MKALLDGLKALGPARIAALVAVAIGMLGMLALMTLRGTTGQMALLYGDLDTRDAAKMVDLLGHHHVPYQVGPSGNEILVPMDQVPEARLMLAKDGLPSGGSVGYEIFDRSDGFASTDFEQRINETRALEGELARTIRVIRGVRAVRVNLVLPRREPFSRDAQEAQAGVMLTMVGADRLDREGVQAILNLVAAAVPGLRPQNIAIIDSRGDLLARAGEPADAAGAARSTDDLRHATELRIARAVEEMLERSLGPGKVRAEATVSMNFDRIKETKESYDPDGQVTRSTQTVNSSSKSTEPNRTVSVQNNLPNADAGSTGAGSQEARREETTNYEISKTVRTLIHQQPQIDRISLAVMVDDVNTVGPDGKRVSKPRSAAELNRIATLVKSAIGFDAKRGDQVDVVSMHFAEDDMAATPKRPGLFGFRLEKADVLRLAQTGLLGLVAVLALLFVLRPMVTRLTALGLGGGMASLPSPGGAQVALAGPAGAALLAGGPGAQALRAGLSATPLLEDESMVNLAQIEGQIRASSIRRVTELVDKHPDETLSIVRGWMVQANG
ncbi:MAG TPA: flagellar basal-body MS-ring/collar protein FliF [Acetobacteraceae bacterium]|nr:flagellar basal-body MS-ring/collar protein FliF [Acetobacteraceae bacterium]